MKNTFLKIVLFWIVFGIFMTGVMVLVHPITNRPVNVWEEFVWEMAFSLVWIAGTPIVLSTARNYSVRSERWMRNAAILFSAGIGLSTVQSLIHGFVIYLSLPEPADLNVNIFLTSLFYNFDKSLIIYTALVIMQHAMEFYRRYQDKEIAASKLETQLSQAQMLALKMQLQPHFLFNTLNAIVTLVRKDPDLAEEMIVRLSDFLRITLESSGKQIVSLKEELEFVRTYLKIEEIRFGGRLVYTEQVPASVWDAQIPMLILQPLIENSIKHGISRYDHAGKLMVTAVRNGETLVVEVKDDASPSVDTSSVTVGIGLTNVKNRLLALYGGEAALSFIPEPVSGVTVKIELPYSESVK